MAEAPKSLETQLQELEAEINRVDDLFYSLHGDMTNFPGEGIRFEDPGLKVIWDDLEKTDVELRAQKDALEAQINAERQRQKKQQEEDKKWAEDKLKADAERHDTLTEAATFRIQEILCQDREQEVIQAAEKAYLKRVEESKAQGYGIYFINGLDARRIVNQRLQDNIKSGRDVRLKLSGLYPEDLLGLIQADRFSLQPSGTFTQDELKTILSPNDRNNNETYNFAYNTRRIFTAQSLMKLADELEKNPGIAALPQSEVELCEGYIAAKQVGTLDQIREAYRKNAAAASDGLTVEEIAKQVPPPHVPSGHALTLNAERIPGNVIVHATDSIQPALWQAIEEFNVKNPSSAVDNIIPAKNMAKPGETISDDQYILHISDGDSKALLQFISEKFPSNTSSATTTLPRASSTEAQERLGRG